jgi:group I intron endonuclease
MKYVVYRFWHNLSAAGRAGYIGKDTNYPKRFNLLRRVKEKGCPKLYRALRKYPIAVWHKEVLASGFRSLASLSRAEKFYVEKFDSKNKGYNCTDGRSGSSPSERTKKKLSELNKGRWVGKKNGFYGRKHSLKTRKHWSKIRKGRKLSPETIAKVVASLIGHAVSHKTRLKLSRAHKGRKWAPEHLAALRRARLWRPNNPKQVISLYELGHSLHDLEKILRVGRHAISRFLKNNGVALRRKSQEQKLRWAKRKENG